MHHARVQRPVRHLIALALVLAVASCAHVPRDAASGAGAPPRRSSAYALRRCTLPVIPTTPITGKSAAPSAVTGRSRAAAQASAKSGGSPVAATAIAVSATERQSTRRTSTDTPSASPPMRTMSSTA